MSTSPFQRRRGSPHPSPQLARAGIRMSEAAPYARRVSDGARKKSRSELTDVFPTLAAPASASAIQITVPDGFAPAAGQSSWYPLIDLGVEDLNLGQEVMVVGFSVSLTSLDPTPGAVPNALAWGTALGDGAAIVFGDGSLPTAGKTDWTAAPCSIAGVESATQLTRNEVNKYLHYELFPPGSYSDAIPFKWNVPFLRVPFVHRFVWGTRLQCALVARGTQVTNSSGSNKFIRCGIHVKMHIGLTTNLRSFTR